MEIDVLKDGVAGGLHLLLNYWCLVHKSTLIVSVSGSIRESYCFSLNYLRDFISIIDDRFRFRETQLSNQIDNEDDDHNRL